MQDVLGYENGLSLKDKKKRDLMHSNGAVSSSIVLLLDLSEVKNGEGDTLKTEVQISCS